jgi:3',5'-nucleoside bisphosphate phosphatase
MNAYKADLHIHTVLSPCASLEMSPRNIVAQAIERGLSVIGITDHNCTFHCQLVKKLGNAQGLMVLVGAEITSREEAHCLTFFEDESSLNQFQKFIEKNQPRIPNDPDLLGYQLLVDENENILDEIEYYLGMALSTGVDEIEKEVHRLGGLFIPAHINRGRFSLISQLGFVPEDINAAALEIFNRSDLEAFLLSHPHLREYTFVKNSDSHSLQQIGSYSSVLHMERLTFEEFRKALKHEDNRHIEIL